MRLFLSGCLIIILNLNAASAAEPSKIELPLYQESSGRVEKFQLCYTIANKDKARNGTVFFLNGGPGMHSVESFLAGKSLLPQKYQLVLMNIRGFGCSQFQDQLNHADAFSTDLVALDTLKLIEHLRLTNYVIFGVSYGTWHATQVAAGLAKMSVEQPKAIVLEGVLGRTFDKSKMDIFTSFSKFWQEVYESSSENVKASFSRSNLPLEFSALEWGKIITSLLPQGEAGFKTQNGWIRFHNLKTYVETVSNPFLTNEIKVQLRTQLAQFLSTYDRPKEEQFAYQRLLCTEISSINNEEAQVSGSTLKMADNFMDFCKYIPLTNSFHSKDWAIKAPLFYFQGEKDPNTPIQMAYEHFLGQTSSIRTFVSVPNAGHNPLEHSLSDCSERIWNDIFVNNVTDSTFHECQFSVQLEKK